MQSKVLDKLELRVNEAVRRIHELQADKLRLDGKVKELTARNKDLKLEIKALSKDSISRADFEQRKKLLEARLGELLRRVDELVEGSDTATAEAS